MSRPSKDVEDVFKAMKNAAKKMIEAAFSAGIAEKIVSSCARHLNRAKRIVLRTWQCEWQTRWRR